MPPIIVLILRCSPVKIFNDGALIDDHLRRRAERIPVSASLETAGDCFGTPFCHPGARNTLPQTPAQSPDRVSDGGRFEAISVKREEKSDTEAIQARVVEISMHVD